MKHEVVYLVVMCHRAAVGRADACTIKETCIGSLVSHRVRLTGHPPQTPNAEVIHMLAHSDSSRMICIRVLCAYVIIICASPELPPAATCRKAFATLRKWMDEPPSTEHHAFMLPCASSHESSCQEFHVVHVLAKPRSRVGLTGHVTYN
ncbi:hypothetical protein K437DRAFT_90268 [Tilletiaria anomala UBC 951]|uniref:Uncharacterized protein n=1 Tax=Tilletiaria anomala (strain ATCC 24038 / CBS 436.72 / UBC 951) TaxID=1037660 RepID=A0A066WB15_TILAU|nr:uncharacterized protein K437DRAFT_90268 [Tilletiaria anomala UBC 951]KDN47960.1 hypothetical protein K437DRAFT_90268 [Tilletiaria anomala UBC 951]